MARRLQRQSSYPIVAGLRRLPAIAAPAGAGRGGQAEEPGGTQRGHRPGSERLLRRHHVVPDRRPHRPGRGALAGPSRRAVAPRARGRRDGQDTTF